MPRKPSRKKQAANKRKTRITVGKVPAKPRAKAKKPIIKCACGGECHCPAMPPRAVLRICKVGSDKRPATEQDIKDVERQLAQVANDPSLTLVTHHNVQFEVHRLIDPAIILGLMDRHAISPTQAKELLLGR